MTSFLNNTEENITKQIQLDRLEKFSPEYLQKINEKNISEQALGSESNNINMKQIK